MASCDPRWEHSACTSALCKITLRDDHVQHLAVSLKAKQENLMRCHGIHGAGGSLVSHPAPLPIWSWRSRDRPLQPMMVQPFLEVAKSPSFLKDWLHCQTVQKFLLVVNLNVLPCDISLLDLVLLAGTVENTSLWWFLRYLRVGLFMFPFSLSRDVLRA